MLIVELLYKSVCSSLLYIADLLHIRALVIPSTVYEHIIGIQRRLQATDLATTHTEYVIATGVREQIFHTIQHAIISSYDIVYHYEDDGTSAMKIHIRDSDNSHQQSLLKMITDRIEDYKKMTVTVNRLYTVYKSLCALAGEDVNCSTSLESGNVDEVAALETVFLGNGSTDFTALDWMPQNWCC